MSRFAIEAFVTAVQVFVTAVLTYYLIAFKVSRSSRVFPGVREHVAYFLSSHTHSPSSLDSAGIFLSFIPWQWHQLLWLY